MRATVHKCEWKDQEKRIATVSSYDVELPRKEQLEFLQKLVGGYIDIYHHRPDGRDWVINDEGILELLPLNPFGLQRELMLCGTIVEIHGRLD